MPQLLQHLTCHHASASFTVSASAAAAAAAALMRQAKEERALAWGALAWAALAVLFTVLVASGTLGGASTGGSQTVVVSGLMANGTTISVGAGSGSSSGEATTMGSVLPASPQPSPPSPSPTSPPLPPPRAPRTPSSGTNSSTAPKANCNLYLTTPIQRAKLGNGWCDAGAPFNTADCGWDGGDCCDTSLPLYDCLDPSSPAFGSASARGLAFPAPTNPLYAAGTAGRTATVAGVAQGYNNYYEFTTGKQVAQFVTATSKKLMQLTSPSFPGWNVTIDGLVARPMNLSLDEVLGMVQVEQRVYRHRCVEAWSMVMPWAGFPLRKLLALAQPLPGAKYVRFESAELPAAMPSVKQYPKGLFPGVPWPYVEGLAIEEAWNDLGFLAVGQYQAALTPQSGGPLRLIVIYNGYGDEVSHLYQNATSPREYFF